MDTNLTRTDRTDLHVMEFPHWFHRSDHTHRVAAAILKHGPIARTTLAQDLGLSQGALSRITSDLIYDGVVEESSADPDESAETRERRGRPQTALRIRQSARTFTGLFCARQLNRSRVWSMPMIWSMSFSYTGMRV